MAEINDYFSDEELAQAKETFKKSDRIHALIRRLEAAEDCIDDHRKSCLWDVGEQCSCGYQEKLEAWRKSKGE
jgi:hypothetical protein